jgi:hypothetical protein
MPADLLQLLGEANYPCSKQELIDYAREQGADDDIVVSLLGLNRGRFHSPADVNDALSEYKH